MEHLTKVFFGTTEYTQTEEDCNSWHSILSKMLDITGFKINDFFFSNIFRYIFLVVLGVLLCIVIETITNGLI